MTRRLPERRRRMKAELRELLKKEGRLTCREIQAHLELVQSAVSNRIKLMGREVRIAGWVIPQGKGGRRAPQYDLRKGGADVPEPPPLSAVERDRAYRQRLVRKAEQKARAAALGPWAGLLRDEREQALERLF